MGLSADLAIITASEVAGITGEVGLSNLDGSSGETLAAALTQATNFLMDWLWGERSVDPAKVANPERLKRAAAYHAAWIRLSAQPDEESQARAQRLIALRDAALKLYVFVSSDAPGEDMNMPPKGLPRSIHTLKVPVFNRPLDNENPFNRRRSSGGWSQK